MDRTAEIKLRVTPGELAAAKANAESQGMNLSAWVRHRVCAVPTSTDNRIRPQAANSESQPQNKLYYRCPNACQGPGQTTPFRRASPGRCPYCNRTCV